MSSAEITVTGGSVAAVLVGIALALAIITVGVWIAIAAYRGYRRSGDQSTYFLAIGIALAAAAHTSARVVLSTIGKPLLFVNTTAIALQFTGLVFILYAVYGNSDRGDVWVSAGAVASGTLVLFLPLLLVQNGTLSEVTSMTLANGITAVLGTFIALQAYRGYHRYASRPMLMLATGIGLLTAGSFAMLNIPLPSLSDAVRIGLVLATEFVGLLLIAFSFHIE